MKQSINNTAQSIKSPLQGDLEGLYSAPRIERIALDNEISLQLQSSPPIGPLETTNMLNSNCFRT